jgi:hypothetical protein
MRIYISLPIGARSEATDEEKEKAAFAAAERKRHELKCQGHEAVTPFDACPVGCRLSRAEMIGKDITLLLTCNGIVKLSGWRKSEGCQIESETARIAGIMVVGDEL